MSLIDLLTNPITASILYIPLGLIAVDVLTGILSAVKTGTFQLKNVSAFMSNDLQKYLVLSIMCFLIYLKNGTDAAFTATSSLGMAALAASTLHSIIQNIGEITSVPQPVQAMIEAQSDAWVNSAIEKPAMPVQVPVRASTPAPVQPQYAYQTPTGNYNVPGNQYAQAPAQPNLSILHQMANPVPSNVPPQSAGAFMQAPVQSAPPVYQSPPDFTQAATIQVPAITPAVITQFNQPPPAPGTTMPTGL